MSLGEGVGLALAAGLVGGVVGAVLVAVITSRRRRDDQRCRHETEASARWLAARLALNRACGSFVAAFRALAIEPRGSRYFPLRMEEAQRVRTQWCDAMRQLDLAEAALLAGSTRLRFLGQPVPLERVGVDALRRAINGDEHEVDRLVQELRKADRRAMDYVRHAGAEAGAWERRSVWPRILARTAGQLESIVDHWSARP